MGAAAGLLAACAPTLDTGCKSDDACGAGQRCVAHRCVALSPDVGAGGEAAGGEAAGGGAVGGTGGRGAPGTDFASGGGSLPSDFGTAGAGGQSLTRS
jgi:hypothetical protein